MDCEPCQMKVRDAAATFFGAARRKANIDHWVETMGNEWMDNSPLKLVEPVENLVRSNNNIEVRNNNDEPPHSRATRKSLMVKFVDGKYVCSIFSTLG